MATAQFPAKEVRQACLRRIADLEEEIEQIPKAKCHTNWAAVAAGIANISFRDHLLNKADRVNDIYYLTTRCEGPVALTHEEARLLCL